MRRFQSLFLSLVLLLPASGAPPEGAQAPDTARGRGGMVVAAEPFAAEAGLEILRQDGNAVDAAVAVAFALAVTYPQAGNLGGGGFMLIRRADGQADFVDYREMAPGAATWNMYLDQDGNLSPEASTQGWRAAGIPGTVAGLELALRTHGTLALGEVMAPAIRLAEEGFPVSERLAEDLKAAADKLSRDPESRKIFLRHGKTYQAGDTLVQKDLARTLKKIAEKGALEFYRGQTAQKIVRASEKGGGLFTLDDLAGYEAKRRQPLAGSFGGYEILTAPPPSSGGVALLETLNMLETLLEPSDRPQEPLTIHLIAEALRRAFADRARYLADTDFAEVPVAGLINKDYAAAFRDSIDTRKASASADLSRPDPLRYQEKAGRQPKPAVVSVRESDQTTHFSVVDAEGNAVANTYTVNSWFGNG
ncbi:MAG: gamma-glutamyltransferase, partial [Terriglobia bacterium]